MGMPAREVIIVGGGAVGLFLACRLEQLGMDWVLVEQKIRPAAHTRSIGIHPPGLERLTELGLADHFISHGVCIRTGKAFANRARLGVISFAGCPGPHNGILTLPQSETEQLLENSVTFKQGDRVKRGLVVTAVQSELTEVRVSGAYSDGTMWEASARYVVGCDGKQSAVRSCVGIEATGQAYPDSYVLADFRDRSGFGADAHVYLADAGLVESFPLPGGVRRWVLKTLAFDAQPAVDTFCREVKHRTGCELSSADNLLINSFGVERRWAVDLVRGRVCLAGDAAHVVSPIGGQGMNLGWLNAWELAQALAEALRGEDSRALPEWARLAMGRAKKAARRAEFNMWLGRARHRPAMRNAAVWLMLHSPVKWFLARLFTMRWL